MTRRWRRGDWVRVKGTNMVFQVNEFSSLDDLEYYPRTPNPDFGKPGQPMYSRFAPEELEEANALDRIVDALDGP